MRQTLPLFRLRSPRLLAHVLRDWFEAGWSPYDLAWHLDHRPAGDPDALAGTLATTALVDAEPWPYAWSRATTSATRSAGSQAGYTDEMRSWAPP